MNSFLKTIVALACSATLLAGCEDSGSDFALGPQGGPSAPAQTRSFSGRVLDQNGAPVSGVSVLLENRTTDESVEVVSGADGTFTAQVPPGTYDAFVDDETADSGLVVKGPLDLSSDLARDLTFETPDSSAAGKVSGRILLPDGQPAADRTILLIPSTASSEDSTLTAVVPDPVQATTDAEGYFETELLTSGQRVGLDFVILRQGAQPPRAGLFDAEPTEDNPPPSETEIAAFVASIEERVDIELTDPGELVVELTAGGPVENLLGVSEVDVDRLPDGLSLPDGDNVTLPVGAGGDFRNNFRKFKARPTDYGQSGFLGIGGERYVSDVRLEFGLIPPSRRAFARQDFQSLSSLADIPETAEYRELNRKLFRPGASGFTYYIADESGIFGYKGPKLEVYASGGVTFTFFDTEGRSDSLRLSNYSILADSPHSVEFGKFGDINTIEVSLNRF